LTEDKKENIKTGMPPITFDRLPDKLKAACGNIGWTELTQVQEVTIPYLMAGKDLMVQSRTGSGKTGAFVLPIIDRIDINSPTCQALVLVPTRELAGQVAEEAKRIAGAKGLRVAAIYGGVGYGPQLKALKAGAHLVVGTPGRILDHLLKHNLTLDDISLLIFDEADRMLSMGFYPDMIELKKYLPRRNINTALFSATYPHIVLRIAGQFLKNPETLSLSRDQVHVTDTEHIYYMVPAMERDRSLVKIIEVENPHSAIIFCNTKDNVHYLATVLKRFGYSVEEISADLSQRGRENVMNKLREGKLRFLVATDLASRGIDIPELSHVIQYEPPEDPENYIHRAGRTGRMGKAGVGITLVTYNDERHLKAVIKQYKIDMIERPVPTPEEVEKIVSERTMVLLEARWRRLDNIQRERLQRFIPMAKLLEDHDDGTPIVAMMLDNVYLASLQDNPEVKTEEQPSEPAPARGRPRYQKSSGRGRPRRK